MVDPKIFKALDIRGKVGQDLTDEVAREVGKAYGTCVRGRQEQTVYIGYDNRPSSNGLADAFAEGLVTTGCQVVEIGMVPTPVLYFASARESGSFGVMVTASHLPAVYNGFKFCQGNQTIYREIPQLRDMVQSAKFISGHGMRSRSGSVAGEYSEYILDNLKLQRSGMKVVVDCQNGAASELAPALLHKLGAQVYRLHCDLTAPYPFERPDPQESANLEPLRKLVVEVNADVGIAYDGDADRLGAVDDKGNFIPADRLVAILARDVLARNPGAKVVIDILSSQIVADQVRRAGGVPIFCPSGHAFVKDTLRQENAVLAGESSGHIFFSDRYLGYDDGIYASARFLELLSRSDQPLSRLMGTLPPAFTSQEERPLCPHDKHRIVEDIRADLTQRGYRLVTIDGVRIQFPNGWGLVRAANTEDVLSLRFEAATEDELQSYRLMVWEKLAEIGQRYGLDFKREA